MTLASLLAYVAALAVAAVIPGPGVVALVGRALGSGFAHGLAFLSGLVLGDLVYLAAACFGLAALAELFGEAFVIVRYAASFYLAYLAWRLWRSASDPARVEAMGAQRKIGSLSAGFLVTLSNPKTIVFYLALLPTLLDLGRIGPADFALLAVATVLVLTITLTPYAALAARARGVLRKPQVLARLNRGAAAILAGTAVWTVLRRT